MTAPVTPRRPFPLQVAHQPDEPAHALLIRAVVHNGSRKFAPVLGRAGVPTNHTVAKVDIDLVAHLCGAELDPLLHASALRVDSGINLLGQRLRAEYFSDMWRRWCPTCLAEHPYHRSWWDVTAVGSCPFHGVELVTRCDCDKPMRHGEHPPAHCRVGHDLREVASRQVAADEAVVDHYIVHRLLGTGAHPHPLLDSTSLGQAMQMMERIGRSQLAEGLSIDDARKEYGIGLMMLVGYRALQDFPRSFRGYLDNLVARSPEEDRTSTLRTYGGFLYWLKNNPDVHDGCALADLLTREIERHAEANVICPTRMLVDGIPVAGVPARTVAEELDLNTELMLRLARTTGFHVVEDHPGGNLMAPGDVERFFARVRSLESMEDAMSVLGVRRTVVIELADLGHLAYVCRPFDRNVPAKGKRGDKRERRLRDAQWNNWYFEPGTAEAFMERLKALVVKDQKIPVGDLVDMYWPTMMFATRADVLKLVLDGTLPLRGIDPETPGMRGLLVSKSEAQALMKRARREGHPLRQAAPLAGMNYNQFLSCVNAGLVETTGSGTRLSVTDEAIEAFKAKYMRAMEVAEIFGVESSRLVIRYLREHGITPFECDGELGTTLYLREIAEPAARSLPPPVAFANARERARYQKERGLAVEATRRSYEVSPDWNKRGNDRSGNNKRTDSPSG